MLEVVNWNKQEDHFTQQLWSQNMKQMWSDEEHTPSADVAVYALLPEDMKKGFKEALAGLTGLDTLQANYGLPAINATEKKLQRKSLLSFMQMMEHVHAKSYSTIFTTVIPDSSEINYLLDDWAPHNPILNRKVDIIKRYYNVNTTLEDQYMLRVSSVFLESYQFYSGFFLPLYLQAQGKMTGSGEVIDVIQRDEAVHGLAIGVMAQELFMMMDEAQQKRVTKKVYDLLSELHVVEMEYTESLYSNIVLPSSEEPLVDQVKAYVRYNANRALMTLGHEQMFEDEHVNPAIINGTNADAEFVTHDFFSQKGFYNKAMNIKPITDTTLGIMHERLKKGRVR